jgi:hypothetical protein
MSRYVWNSCLLTTPFTRTPPAAQLMSNLSSIILHAPPQSTFPQPSPVSDRRTQAELWAQKALEVIGAATGMVGTGEKSRSFKLRQGGTGDGTCDAALGSTLFNLGILREVSLPR